MRNATREKLFNDNEYIVLWTHETPNGIVTLLSVQARAVIVHEFPNPDDGFEVYIQSKGVRIEDAREQMNLPPKRSTT